MADDDNGDTGALAEHLQGSEGATDVLVTIGIVAALQVGHEGIDDHHGGIGFYDDALQNQDMAGDGERPPEWAAVRDGQERDDASRVTASGVDARADRIVEIVLGGENDDVTRSARRPAGQSLTTGNAGGELAEEGALAEAGIAIEDSDLAGGEAAGREPLHGLRVDLPQADDVAQWVAPGPIGISFIIMKIRLRWAHRVTPCCRAVWV
jgi:hypothetical protein